MSMIKVWKNNEQLCTGRLVGFIDDEECRAVMNSPDAGKKIFTSADIPMDQMNSNCSGKRFVVATSDYGDTLRKIFISPVIKYMSYVSNHKSFTCEDDHEYVVRTVI